MHYKPIRAHEEAIGGYKMLQGTISGKALEEVLKDLLEGPGFFEVLKAPAVLVMFASDFACLVKFPYLFFRRGPGPQAST